MRDLEIIVPTRNRPEVLRRSLSRTRAHFPDVPILVHDDASDDASAVAAAVGRIEGCRLIRASARIGPAGARRRLISEAGARWCLALDDDCYPSATFDPGRWVATEPDRDGVIAVSFRYWRSTDGDLAPPGNLATGPSRCFMGGASLLHRARVIEIGNYRGYLVFAAEDTELSRRIWAAGGQVWGDPDNVIVHDHVAVGRDLPAEAYYYVRNRILLNVLTLPLWYGLPLGLAQAGRRWLAQPHRAAGFAGLAAGILAAVRHYPDRTPLTLERYRWLERLPA